MRTTASPLITLTLAGLSLALSLYANWSSPRVEPLAGGPGAQVVVAAVPPTADDFQVLAARVAQLEASLEALRAAAGPRAAHVAAADERSQDDVGRGDLAALGAPPPEGLVAFAADDSIVRDRQPVMRQELSALVAQELRDAEQRRRDDRRARREAHAGERLQAFLEEVDLDADRAQKLGAILAGERAEIDALVQRARDDDDWRGLREEIERVRGSSDENAKALLDDDELAAYRAMREDEPFRRPPRGRGAPAGEP